MWRTRVGYAGGEMARPTYRTMGDHTECFQVDFDPAVVSYDTLLEEFWLSHDATHSAWKTQYASLVLTHDDRQLEAARASAARYESALGVSVATRIQPVGEFWMAEDYHQKYYLRNDRLLMGEMRAAYRDERGFVDSTAAARINGYLGGAASCAGLEETLPVLGLSSHGADHLRTRCRRQGL